MWGGGGELGGGYLRKKPCRQLLLACFLTHKLTIQWTRCQSRCFQASTAAALIGHFG